MGVIGLYLARELVNFVPDDTTGDVTRCLQSLGQSVSEPGVTKPNLSTTCK
jgi:hypothetical protein